MPVVVIANKGRGVSLHEWTLRDGQGNVYLFPDLFLGPDTEVRVHTGAGENTPQHLYWNRDTAVWDDPADTAILADPQGVVHALEECQLPLEALDRLGVAPLQGRQVPEAHVGANDDEALPPRQQ